MGAQDRTVAQSVTGSETPPGIDEFELTLLGPGYGESIALHMGGGNWIVADSCLDSDGTPGALRYLENIGLDPARAVKLIVASHWHDDHIRGMARMVEVCSEADFCCASALCREEFLALVGALEGRHFSAAGSGLREIHRVFSRLGEAGGRPVHALANRVVFQREDCKVWSLSPGDDVFQRFLRSVGGLIPSKGKSKTRIPDLSPNEAAVALWIDTRHFALLLGADLEKHGWVTIVKSSGRPAGRASVFKVPHHGSESADEPAVWRKMLESNPVAVLTPWRRGGRVLPSGRDAERILAATSCAYVSNANAGSPRSGFDHGNKAVARTLRESGARFRRPSFRAGSLRLRRPLDARTPWTVELFGDACHLEHYAARQGPCPTRA